MEPFTLLVVIGAAGLGGCVQGLTGFGSTVVALPLLGLALPVRDAVAVGCLMALATNLLLIFRLHHWVNRPALGSSCWLHCQEWWAERSCCAWLRNSG